MAQLAETRVLLSGLKISSRIHGSLEWCVRNKTMFDAFSLHTSPPQTLREQPFCTSHAHPSMMRQQLFP
ncbi:hypothetical protein [Scytonema sp. NUACC21]